MTDSSPHDSPCIIQYLDSVHQLWCQFPTEFEFNLELLRQLAFYAYSSAFCNMVMKSEYERKKANSKKKGLSFWSYVLHRREDFENVLYSPKKELLTVNPNEKVMRIWREFFVSEKLKIFESLDPFVSAMLIIVLGQHL